MRHILAITLVLLAAFAPAADKDIPYNQKRANGTNEAKVLAPAATAVVITGASKELDSTPQSTFASSVLGGTTVGINIFKAPNPSAITFLRANANNTVDLLSAADFKTAIGVASGTTVGSNLLNLTNPSSITFIRINADNSVSALNASDFRTAIGVGTGSGSVTTVSVVTANGISGTVANASTTPAITLSLGDIAPTGILGTATNDSAAAGNVGQIVSSLVPFGSKISLTNNTGANVTSISLTAGDWDVEGNVSLGEQLSTISVREASINTTSATTATDGSQGYFGYQTTTTSATNTITLTRRRISINSTTTIYLTITVAFSAGTVDAWGTITARRVR